MLRTTATICALSLALFTAGCAKKSVVPESETEITSARLKRPNVHVSDELKKACAIRWDAVERAPKFAYDDDGDVVLTLELPTESIDPSEIRGALTTLLEQAVAHRRTLRLASTT